jgi:hypothetical protein
MNSENAPQRREIDYARLERNKDLAQEAVQSTASRVGRIATIITGAVADVAREIGELITDGFEMREAAKQAKLDAARLDRIAADRLADTIEQAEVDELALEAGHVQDADIEIEVETD